VYFPAVCIAEVAGRQADYIERAAQVQELAVEFLRVCEYGIEMWKFLNVTLEYVVNVVKRLLLSRNIWKKM
jgi:hypothetical protein